jgi:hypothetical protein
MAYIIDEKAKIQTCKYDSQSDAKGVSDLRNQKLSIIDREVQQGHL